MYIILKISNQKRLFSFVSLLIVSSEHTAHKYFSVSKGYPLWCMHDDSVAHCMFTFFSHQVFIKDPSGTSDITSVSSF